MREIVHIPVGHLGNQIGLKFLDVIGREHCISSDGNLLPVQDSPYDLPRRDRLNVYYNECEGGRYAPRAVLVDLDPKFLTGAVLPKFIPSSSIICGKGGTNNLFAKGHYTDGADLLDSILDSIRKEVEACECVQGFQMVHSLGGGTGSGLGTLVLSRVRDDYPDKSMLSFCVSPYSGAGDPVVAPYNAVLSLHQLIENSDQTLIIDKQALLNLYGDAAQGNYDDMNAIVSHVMSGMTSCYRFPSPLNLDLRKISVKMVPFPRMHMFVSALAPLVTDGTQKLSVSELTEQTYSPKNLIACCDPNKGRYLATSTYYRGAVSIREIDEHLLAMRQCKQDQIGILAPYETITGLCNVPQDNLEISATYVHNSTAVKTNFIRIIKEFNSLFKSKAFTHPYMAEGMDEMEFIEAESNLLDVVNEYAIFEKK